MWCCNLLKKASGLLFFAIHCLVLHAHPCASVGGLWEIRVAGLCGDSSVWPLLIKLTSCSNFSACLVAPFLCHEH